MPPVCRITAMRTNHAGKGRLTLRPEAFLHSAHRNGVTIHFHYTQSHQMLRFYCLVVMQSLCWKVTEAISYRMV